MYFPFGIMTDILGIVKKALSMNELSMQSYYMFLLFLLLELLYLFDKIIKLDNTSTIQIHLN